MNILTKGNAFYTLFAKHYWKVFATQTAMWSIAMIIQNPTLVDVSWCFGHFLIGTLIVTKNFSNFGRIFQGFHNFGGYLLLTSWLLRLGGFLFYYRIWKQHVDPRYKALSNKYEGWRKKLYFFFQFQMQGVLFTLTSIPLFWLFAESSKRQLNFVNVIGIGLAIIGILGEAVADQQLQNFKDRKIDETNKNSLFREGLFKNSRHPNLFFELCFWTGMAFFAINYSNLYSIFALVGPILLWAIMNYLTIPITMNHMKSKPGYLEYLKETNKFLPLKLL